jgi:hypothetical protein
MGEIFDDDETWTHLAYLERLYEEFLEEGHSEEDAQFSVAEYLLNFLPS